MPLQGQTGHEGEERSPLTECEYKWKLSFYILQPGGECDQRATQTQDNTEVFLSCV